MISVLSSLSCVLTFILATPGVQGYKSACLAQRDGTVCVDLDTNNFNCVHTKKADSCEVEGKYAICRENGKPVLEVLCGAQFFNQATGAVATLQCHPRKGA